MPKRLSPAYESLRPLGERIPYGTYRLWAILGYGLKRTAITKWTDNGTEEKA